ncbi:NADPH-dependent FMN reductase [Dyella mobilis]|uniref:NAD(P)H-dependent oxidoreductase n=1 Tax=Dyella mobilis TaxID=1849582 RepID=A0ABS2KCU6_9GAMM|nr:NADPH-dependent FMN reductase [Dyella mobilis]MBM7128992.1 NAD(P)H-dependent oxidoreductase [Dyella mobilis]GLQ99313.1 NADPH-dependent FMN reductase [Dyella mobilis]
MRRTLTVGVVVGSLRKDSINLKLANALVSLGQGLAFKFVPIADLPLYNPDIDGPDTPAAWVKFRERIHAVDAVLFVTPEYNRSVPGGLKNALDVGSRPMGQSVWNGKPCAIATASPGGIGGFGANHALRQSLTFLNMPAMQQPEAYIGGAFELLDEEGRLVKKETKSFLENFMLRFASWVERNVSDDVPVKKVS